MLQEENSNSGKPLTEQLEDKMSKSLERGCCLGSIISSIVISAIINFNIIAIVVFSVIIGVYFLVTLFKSTIISSENADEVVVETDSPISNLNENIENFRTQL